MLQWVELYRREGGKMGVAGPERPARCTTSSRTSASWPPPAWTSSTTTAARPTSFWQAGRIDDCLPYVKCMRDCGVAVGLGTHMPEVIEYAEEHGWDVDYYMACVYNLSRHPRESAIVTGRTDTYRTRSTWRRTASGCAGSSGRWKSPCWPSRSWRPGAVPRRKSRSARHSPMPSATSSHRRRGGGAVPQGDRSSGAGPPVLAGGVRGRGGEVGGTGFPTCAEARLD